MSVHTQSISSMISGFAKQACDRMDDELRLEFTQFINRYKVNGGGFCGRSPESDLYFTFFGIECLHALKERIPYSNLEEYLTPYCCGTGLDFVHLASLMRCIARFPDCESSHCCQFDVHNLFNELERFRSQNGGFKLNRSLKNESIYASFIALMIYEELERRMTNSEGVLQSIERFRSNDGAYTEGINLDVGTTTVTSAALILKSNLEQNNCDSLCDWLIKQCDENGGFLASPQAPCADLLSTTTALIALKYLNYPLNEIREKCLSFIETMWHKDGGFRGNAMDSKADVEYTYYGFISLGILASE